MFEKENFYLFIGGDTHGQLIHLGGDPDDCYAMDKKHYPATECIPENKFEINEDGTISKSEISVNNIYHDKEVYRKVRFIDGTNFNCFFVLDGMDKETAFVMYINQSDKLAIKERIEKDIARQIERNIEIETRKILGIYDTNKTGG